MEKVTDMTQGKPLRLLIGFALPMLIGDIFQQLYSLVDSIVVGRFVSKEALAAIGATNAPLFLMISVIIGFTMGIAIVTAQFRGAHDTGGLRSTFATATWISLIASASLATLGCLFARPILALLGTPADILEGSITYLLINFSTCLAPIAYNMSANFLRSIGDSKTPLFAMVISSVMNIVLDLVFVLAFGMGIAGVAIATAISQGASAAFSIWRLHKLFPDALPQRGGWKPSGIIFRRVLKYGVPMSLQNAFMSFGMMAVQRVINGFGTNVVAGYTAANKLDSLALQSLSTMGSAMTTYAGQNYGARDEHRIRQGVRAGLILTVAVSAVLSLVLVFGGPLLAQLFLKSSETEALDVAAGFLRTVCLFYPLCAAMYVYTDTLRGMGKVVVPTVGSFVELGIKIAGAYLFSAFFGFQGIWFAWPLAWLLTTGLLAANYHLGRWKKELQAPPEPLSEDTAG